MKMLNEKELSQVNGGIYDGYTGGDRIPELMKQKRQREWFENKKAELEGLADIRMRAGEDALKAAMRINRQEAEIKEAMKAQREALGLN